MPRHDVPVTVLLDALPERRVVGEPPPSVRGLTADSRRVEAGDCFVAVPGFKQDARRFVPDAVARGARLVVTEGEPLGRRCAVAQVLVPSARRRWRGWPAPSTAIRRPRSRWSASPAPTARPPRRYLVDALLRARAARAPGIIGTIQYVVGAETRAGQPDDAGGARARRRCWREMRAAGVGGVAMEVSSHALALIPGGRARSSTWPCSPT